MLTKNQIAAEVEVITGIKPNLVKNVLDALAQIAADEVAAGEDFTVPGIAKVMYTYREPQKKGSRWVKGDDRVDRFTSEIQVATEDSPAVKEAIKLRAVTAGKLSSLKPGSKAEAQAAFLKTKTAKTVRARKVKA